MGHWGFFGGLGHVQKRTQLEGRGNGFSRGGWKCRYLSLVPSTRQYDFSFSVYLNHSLGETVISLFFSKAKSESDGLAPIIRAVN